jgi:hypothetical protein
MKLTEEQEQAKALATYKRQVTAFRKALDSGNRSLALELAQTFNWCRDNIADQLCDWLDPH